MLLTHSWHKKKRIHTFPEGICTKVNAIDQTRIWTGFIGYTFCADIFYNTRAFDYLSFHKTKRKLSFINAFIDQYLTLKKKYIYLKLVCLWKWKIFAMLSKWQNIGLILKELSPANRNTECYFVCHNIYFNPLLTFPWINAHTNMIRWSENIRLILYLVTGMPQWFMEIMLDQVFFSAVGTMQSIRNCTANKLTYSLWKY